MQDSSTLYSAEGSFMLELQNYYLKQPYYKTQGHRHHYLELSCVKGGRGKYYVDNAVYEVEEGDVFVFNNIEKHDIDVVGDVDLVNMVIHFEPRFIWNEGGNMFDYRYLAIFFNRSSFFKNRLQNGKESTKAIFNLLLQIEQEFINKYPGYELMIKVRLLEILVRIIRDFDYAADGNVKTGNADPQLGTINKLLKYIDAHIEDEIRLQDLSEVAHMNASYLSTLFKKYNGIGPIEYISRKRIHKAVQYLKSSDKSITEIAGLCGFNNAANFNKTFKKFTGSTPSEYRNNKGAAL
jgi:AraC-like DNA-binding protein